MQPAACLAAALLALAGCGTVAAPAGPRESAAPPIAVPTAASAAPDPGVSDRPRAARDRAGDTAAEPPTGVRTDDGTGESDLQARLAARARTLLGRRGPFRVAGERFNGDCSGFAQAVYAAEGVDLRGLMQRVAPEERGGVKAAWLAARAHGRTFGAEEWPRPGDLVFWHDTYDRNRNRKADDPLTHLGIVEHVEGGTISFLHRGVKGVARGVMTLEHRRDARAPDGRRLNSVLRAPAHPVKKGGLASELFAGYARFGDAWVAARGDARSAVSPEPSATKTATSRTTVASRRTATREKTAIPRRTATSRKAASSGKTVTSRKTATSKKRATSRQAATSRKSATPDETATVERGATP